jgi:glutamate synthase domain-containing protein 2
VVCSRPIPDETAAGTFEIVKREGRERRMGFIALALTPRYVVLTTCVILTLMLLAIGALTGWSDPIIVLAVIFGALAALGFRDIMQESHAILRNYPIAGHMRFILEEVRPEIRQYFFESEKDGMPFSRDKRALVYQRAKMQLSTRPFGTQYDVYQGGYEWLQHAVASRPHAKDAFRITVGGPDCTKPYSASIFNISAMSFGSLSRNAIRALNGGAKKGNFSHDTGEGGLSPYHRENGGDLVWEIGSGYFGCRNPDGTFNAERFSATATIDQVKMVELKMSQGAKPGHGGILPAAKVSPEIAAIRGISVGYDCVSPARHSAFSTPIGMMEFIGEMRRLSGGKPAGFKLCLGQPWEFLAICKAMLETGIYPDFIVVDGKEGGTGAAPLEFMDHLGMPLREGLNFVHNALIGIGARDRIKIGAAGKIISAFDIARAMALGADWCNAGRGFMFSIGCIQSLSCHTDRCPTGVATQDETRSRAIVVPDKIDRVYNFHRSTLATLSELVAAAGLDHPSEFIPSHFCRRMNDGGVRTFAQLYPALRPGELLEGTKDERFREAWQLARAQAFNVTTPST